MDVIVTLMISAGILVLLLVILLIVWAMMPDSKKRVNNRESAKEDIKHIKEEIQHEAMEEIAPYRPPKLSTPSRKRL